MYGHLGSRLNSDVTSAISPLAIEGVKDRDGQANLACRLVKLEGVNGGKEKGAALAEHTTAPAQLACLAVNACCESCKTTRCKCCKDACVCVTCWCLGRCPNQATHTQRDRTTLTGNAEGKLGKGEGKHKRQRGRLKENADPRTTRVRMETEATGKGEDKSAGDRATTTPLEDGEGTAGDVLGYQPTTEDLCLQEVYKDWVHANTARISTEMSATTRRGRHGGVTSRSCHRGAMMRRVGKSVEGLS